jgi:hypothetical protein
MENKRKLSAKELLKRIQEMLNTIEVNRKITLARGLLL